jgi:hypothetical protein
MKQPGYSYIEGKTYTLFNNSGSTSGYYKKVRFVADEILNSYPDPRIILDTILAWSSRKKALKKILQSDKNPSLISTIIHLTDLHFSEFTGNTEKHLASLPISKTWDRRLATSREQYHLYMLEIELTNRISRMKFIESERKIALLPYCLQDFTVSCKSEKNGFDYQCMHCSGACFQNHASKILKNYSIEPYIWSGGKLQQLAKHTLKDNRSFGVLGIACIPELMWGMRNCRKKNIPVVGLPLNANRCMRWFGEFHPNSIDLCELDSLVR